MRRLLSIFILIVLMFNNVAYHFCFAILERQADKKLADTIEANHFDPTKLILIKIPLNLPYQTAWTDYERTDGEIELNDTIYRYVERKVTDNYLLLLCIPNKAKMLISSARDQFFEQLNDLQKSTQRTRTNIVKFNIDDFLIQAVCQKKLVPLLVCLSYSIRNQAIYSFNSSNELLRPPQV